MTLPWVLRLPIPAQSPGRRPAEPLSRRRRPRWTWLWSWWSLLTLLAVTTVGGSYLHARLSSAHCSVRFPFSANTDTQLRADAAGSRECVGIATGGVRLERGSLSTGLDGDRRRPDPAHSGGRLTLADLPTPSRRSGRAGRPEQSLLTDGQMSMTYDATSALTQAALKAFSTLGLSPYGGARTADSGSVTSGSVLLELPLLKANQGATGTIDFTRDQHTLYGSGRRGLTLVKVTMRSGQPDYRPICGRMNGALPVPGLPPAR